MKTKTTTFRINESYSNELDIIADESKISTNALVNQIIGEYVTIEKPMKQYGVITGSTDLFLELINTLDKKDLKRIGEKIGSSEPKEFIKLKWNEITRGTVLEFISIYCNHCGYGRPEIISTNETIKIIINHGLGEKFSTYLESFVEAMIKSTLGKKCTFNSRKSMILISIPE